MLRISCKKALLSLPEIDDDAYTTGSVVHYRSFGADADMGYYGKCSCGYKGPWRVLLGEARNDVLLHWQNDVSMSRHVITVVLRAGRMILERDLWYYS
jgi:hypothetical protein